MYESYNLPTAKNNIVDDEKHQNKKKSVQFNDKEHVIKKVTRANISEIDIQEGNNKPWSRVLYNPNDEYSYYFYIKIKIPSLNDYENWRKIIPNLNFDPRTGELIIPSKDEASALALANLIVVNFNGQLSLDDILQKKLIQISVAKAKNHEIVQNKLREQIMDNLYGTSLEPNQSNQSNQPNEFNTSIQQETVVENPQLIEAYTGTDYAYL